MIGLIVVLGSEFILRDVFLPQQARDVHIGIAVALEWLVLLILLAFWMPRIEGHGFDSIGIGRFKWRDLWMGILTFSILMIAWIGSGFALEAIGPKGLRSLQPKIAGYGLPIRFSLLLTGTFLEEVIYRGYVIERLTSLTGRIWLAGFMSWVAFTLVHVKFFGLGPTLEVGVIAAGLVVLYLRERSIWPCVVLHGMNDVLGLLVAPLLM